MQILKPLGNKISEKVKSWSQIRNEARELKDFLDAGKFEGNWKSAYAISHTQVSNEPKCFFVVNNNVKRYFGHWCVVNAKIVKSSEPCTFSEACMSFMHRDIKKVDRFAKITVTYWTPLFDRFLIPRRKTFHTKLEDGPVSNPKDFVPFIFQHEVDHASGKNIYSL